jgi:hypothetical protein
MAKANVRRGFSGRRRIQGKQDHPPDWHLQVRVLDAEGEEIGRNIIYLGAFNGGAAKVKALPKSQNYARQVVGDPDIRRDIRFIADLRKVPVNGNGTNGVPFYKLRNRYTYCDSLLSAKRPSAVFKVSGYGHNGNGRAIDH